MAVLLAYAGLLLTSLIAGTFLPFLPGSSEMAMAGLLAAGIGTPAVIIAIAVIANVVGATINYLIGRNVAGLAGRHWFPLSESSLTKVSDWFRRYGVWALAMCWLPTFGDAITVVAGLLRTDLRVFVLLVFLGKLFGHLVVASGVRLVL